MKQILLPLPQTRKRVHGGRRSKAIKKTVAEKYGTPKPPNKGGKKPAPTFQKKIVVIEYMGDDAPKTFGLKESFVLMRGMLPDISLTATEKEVCAHICEVIRSDDSYGYCTEKDFEFLEATGKSICVPAKPANFTWNGKAVKSLSGSGSVYIRFVVDHEILNRASNTGSDSDIDDGSEIEITNVESKFI